jgi:hypothetical protein
MSPARRQNKHSRSSPPFVRLGRDMIFNCAEWRKLKPASKLLYICIKAKYNGSNNGKIGLTYSELKGYKGLSSPSTISKAQDELIKNNWIKITHHGGLFRYFNLYELTWMHDELQ